MRDPKVLTSLLILLVVGLHAVPVLSYEGRRQTRWPFLVWAMYKNSRPPGPIEARNTRVTGVTRSGGMEAVTPRLVGLPWPTVRDMYISPMRTGDSAAARQLFGRLNRGRQDPFVEVQVRVKTYRITDSGVVSEDTVLAYRAERSEST